MYNIFGAIYIKIVEVNSTHTSYNFVLGKKNDDFVSSKSCTVARILIINCQFSVRATSGKGQVKGHRQGLVSKSARSNAKDRNKETTVTLTRLKGNV